ncbi:MAG: type II 3-dehydroquinate dehydratase [Pseudomonadota bacterium]|nr:type II 3-dehydroquinate dehydratase [Pseudomonadota bacterium]
MANLLLINGPNLNLLGKREPEVYGETTLSQIEVKLKKEAVGLGHELECIQSNAESDLVDKVQSSVDKVDFILLNPGALTHTSVALRDALLAVAIPFIEIHISNIHAREEFRQKSYFSDIAEGVIEGLGPKGYSLALEAASNRLSPTET